jgi:hypothetical protein
VVYACRNLAAGFDRDLPDDQAVRRAPAINADG